MVDRTEEEQIEAIKQWWNENGKSIVIGIVVALAAVFGYQGWQNRVQSTGEAASAIYEDMTAAIVLDSPFATLTEEQRSTGRFLANQLKTDYADSAYAKFAALFLAKMAVDEENYATARDELNWALDSGLDDSLEVMTRIRLARVQLALGEPEAALETLNKVDPGEHQPTFEEVRGDIYMSKGDRTLAREAYQRALAGVEDDQLRPMLQMKLDDLIVPERLAPADEAGQDDATGEDS
ncbi:MAG: YfgM family protein [Pseudomonadota bacterium]